MSADPATRPVAAAAVEDVTCDPAVGLAGWAAKGDRGILDGTWRLDRRPDPHTEYVRCERQGADHRFDQVMGAGGLHRVSS